MVGQSEYIWPSQVDRQTLNSSKIDEQIEVVTQKEIVMHIYRQANSNTECYALKKRSFRSRMD